MKIPGKALILEACDASVSFDQASGEKASARLNMVAYSGGIIKGHWHWDDLALDLSGIMLPKAKYPILESHDTSAKIGFTGKPIVGADLRIDPESTVFVSTPQSEEFQRLSAEGFPFEASIRVKPLAIERVAEGAMVDVNGIKLKGPGTVFRKWVFVEASVCTLTCPSPAWAGKSQSFRFN